MIFDSFIDELEKIAGSRLRRALSVVKSKTTSEYRILLNSKQIGQVPVGPIRDSTGPLTSIEMSSHIDPKYRGLRIYPKVLGEILKKEERLASGGVLSGSAERQWSRFSKNNPGVVIRNPRAETIEYPTHLRKGRGPVYRVSSGDGEPVFIATKPKVWTR